MTRYPIKDQIAIVGVGSTGFSRSAGRSIESLALEACTQAVADAGLTKDDIDGVCGTAPMAEYMISALGLPEVTYYGNQQVVLVFTLTDAMNAIFSGACDVVVCYHAVYRVPVHSRSAAEDPFRRRLGRGGYPPPIPARSDPEVIDGFPYPAWAQRYMYESGSTRKQLGYVAVNDRSNAGRNPLAAIRDPMTLDDYLEARMVAEPLCMLDMDVPVDGADAFVLTSVERARELTSKPVVIHAAAYAAKAPEAAFDATAQLPALSERPQHAVVRKLRERSDLWIDDADLYFPYDGFSFLTLLWAEAAGWCGPGEGGDFIEQHWDATTSRIVIEGKIPINPHGGALSEGGTQGSGHIREAVVQLRGSAGERQVPNAKTAVLTLGGLLYNAQGLVLRSD